MLAGAWAEVDVEADLRLVGGSVGDAYGYVARTTQEERQVVIATIGNAEGGPSDLELTYQQALLSLVDPLLRQVDTSALTVLGN